MVEVVDIFFLKMYSVNIYISVIFLVVLFVDVKSDQNRMRLESLYIMYYNDVQVQCCWTIWTWQTRDVLKMCSSLVDRAV